MTGRDRHANVMLLLGGGVKGGKVYVFAEILPKRMCVKKFDRGFPAYPVEDKRRLRLIPS